MSTPTSSAGSPTEDLSSLSTSSVHNSAGCARAGYGAGVAHLLEQPLWRFTSKNGDPAALRPGLTERSGDTCPARQLQRCQVAFHRPDQAKVEQMAAALGATGVPTSGSVRSS